MSRMTPKRRELLEAARRDALALHHEWRDAMAHHQVRVEAQFRELASRLRPRARGRQPKGLPSAKLAKDLHERLSAAHIKPGKGRAKDLRRVERILQAALRDLPAEP